MDGTAKGYVKTRCLINKKGHPEVEVRMEEREKNDSLSRAKRCK